jgi:hypothetical protein
LHAWTLFVVVRVTKAMRSFVLALLASLGGLAALLGGVRIILHGSLEGFLGLLTVFSLGVGAVSAAALYFPAMAVVQNRSSRHSLARYVVIGGVAGLIPGVSLVLLLGWIAFGSSRQMISLLEVPESLVVCIASVVSGMVYGAGFFVMFVRRWA